MRCYILFLPSIFVCSLTTAQENRTYTVKEGTRPRDVFTYSDIYLFPTFQSGVVRFRNNREGYGSMNYNRYTGEINFIQGKDTLELADPETIKSIAIGKNTFVFQVGIGYIESLEGTSDATFGKREAFQITDRKRQRTSAPNGTPNYFVTPGSGGVNAGTPAAMTGGLAKEYVDIIYRKKTEFFFANKNGFFLAPNKKNIVSIYPKQKEVITIYLTDHQVDFDNEESLRGLFAVIIDQK